MVKTRAQLIEDAGEDREAMIRFLDKHDKDMNKNYKIIIIIALVVLAIIQITIYGVLSVR